MCRLKTASVDLNVDTGKSQCCGLVGFFPLDTLLSFDSFLVTKNENLNPSPLPSVWWENAKPVHTKLAVGFWWREKWIKLPYRNHETSVKAAAINSHVTSYQRWALLNEGFDQTNGKWRVVGQEYTAVPQLTCMIEYCQGIWHYLLQSLQA